jgi:hypothetical protein
VQAQGETPLAQGTGLKFAHPTEAWAGHLGDPNAKAHKCFFNKSIFISYI